MLLPQKKHIHTNTEHLWFSSLLNALNFWHWLQTLVFNVQSDHTKVTKPVHTGLNKSLKYNHNFWHIQKSNKNTN